MRRKALIALAAIVASLATCQTGRADLQGMEVASLEWLIDSSDAIAVGEVGSTYADAYRITQAIKDHKELRVGQTVKGRSEYGAKGDPVMLFLREKRGGLIVFEAVNFATTFQLRVDDGNVEEDSPKKWQKYLAVDKKGNIISNRDELIRRVKNRLRSGSSLPADCNREAVENGKSVRGGFRIASDGFYQLGEKDENVADVYLLLLVPADPEFQEDLKKTLALPKGDNSGPFRRDQIRAILQENYCGQVSGKKS
jgi:hypothetical protein